MRLIAVEDNKPPQPLILEPTSSSSPNSTSKNNNDSNPPLLAFVKGDIITFLGDVHPLSKGQFLKGDICGVMGFFPKEKVNLMPNPFVASVAPLTDRMSRKNRSQQALGGSGGPVGSPPKIGHYRSKSEVNLMNLDGPPSKVSQ